MSNSTSAESVSGELPPVKILIVEDDPMMQLGLEQTLGEYH
jgi:hypothetical protein